MSERLFNVHAFRSAHGGPSVKRVTIDEVMGWMGDIFETFNPLRDLGPIRLPFPDMWLEWETGKEQVGVRVRELDDSLLSLDLYGRYRNGLTKFMSHVVAVDGTGTFEEMVRVDESSDHSLYEAGLRTATARRLQATKGREFVASYYRTLTEKCPLQMACMLAISLMNCKNVGIENHEPPRSRSSRPADRKAAAAKLDFHTIKLPSKASASNSEKIASLGGTMPFHMVRGNFATYTEDAPLFGHTVGTVWRPHHVRGKKSNGIVISDYEVTPS